MSNGKKGKVFKVLISILVALAAFVAVTVGVTLVGNRANLAKAKAFATVEYENQLAPEKDSHGNWTFTTDEDFKVLQLTDVHIGGGWMSLKKDGMALNAVAAMVTAEKPD